MQFKGKGSVEENYSKRASSLSSWLYFSINKQLPQAVRAALLVGFLGRVSSGALLAFLLRICKNGSSDTSSVQA